MIDPYPDFADYPVQPLTPEEITTLAAEHPHWSHENVHRECSTYPCLVVRVLCENAALRGQNEDLENELVALLRGDRKGA